MKPRAPGQLLRDYLTTGQLIVRRGQLVFEAPKPMSRRPKPFRAGKPKPAAPANPK